MDRSEQIAAMKPGGYLINVARGQVLDEEALIDALQSGHLAGAGVDVTYTEPLPEDSPLWDDPNVLITPHVGNQSARRVDDSNDLACVNLRRYFHGETIINRVDKTLSFLTRTIRTQPGFNQDHEQLARDSSWRCDPVSRRPRGGSLADATNAPGLVCGRIQPHLSIHQFVDHGSTTRSNDESTDAKSTLQIQQAQSSQQ